MIMVVSREQRFLVEYIKRNTVAQGNSTGQSIYKKEKAYIYCTVHTAIPI